MLQIKISIKTVVLIIKTFNIMINILMWKHKNIIT